MKLFYRLGFYLVGFSIGLILLSVIFKGKKASCNYGPNERVISNLSKKRWNSNLEDSFTFDSISFNEFLDMANVDFNRSDTSRDSCKVYHLDGFWKKQAIYIEVENCEKNVNLIYLNLKSK